jgi:hypothetical protein
MRKQFLVSLECCAQKRGVFFTHVCDHTTFHKQVIPNFWALEVHNINLRHITGWC